MKIQAYYYDNGIKHIEFDHLNWNRSCPENILKMFFQVSETNWREVSGYAIYYLYREGIISGRYIFGGINQTKGYALDGSLVTVDITKIIPKKSALKSIRYGYEVSDDLWKEVGNLTVK